VTQRVLVVDDTEQIRLLLRLNFELDGFEVLEASDGGTALDLLCAAADAGELPAAVTVDAVMEPVDGWTALQRIRRDPRLAHLPVVMVTASVQAHQRARARAVGVDAFVAKPFDPEHLVAVVTQLARDGRPGRSRRREGHGGRG
jgi:CheY-like chemotaxis protein